jgi:crotonobetainyl-CoA:carnitine CoA-transferase CaiB-like acyl-CoA transferase
MFTGGADPVLPTPFHIGAAAAATLAASGLAATELWQVRTGRRQRVKVDLRQAMAASRSGHYLQLADADVSSERNAIMGFYPTRDGRWAYLHCNFPNHRAAALSVLGVAEDREAGGARGGYLERAADLEEAIIAAKGAGGVARTQAEWARHPQGAAVAALPLMEIMRIGDSAPEPLARADVRQCPQNVSAMFGERAGTSRSGKDASQVKDADARERPITGWTSHDVASAAGFGP